MSSNKIGNLLYSPSQIAEWFDIPSSTLAHWEKNGLIDEADRGPNGERIYKWHHIKQIVEKVREQIRDEIDLLIQEHPEELIPPHELLERLYKTEFFGGDEPEHGLQQLEGLAQEDGLSSNTINSLIKEASIRPRGDSIRPHVWRILLVDEELEH